MIFSRRNLVNIVVPLMVSQVLSVAIGMEDSIMVSSAGAAAISGVSLVDTLNVLLVYLFTSLSAGGSVVMSRKLGEGKNREAKEDLTFIVGLTVAFGAVVTVLALVFAEPILGLLGATENLYSVAYDYYKVLVMFTIPCLLQVQFQYLFVTAGAPSLGLGCVVAGGVSNVILDYVFIVPLDMGIQGAALATGIGYSIPAVVGLVWFACNRKGMLCFTLPKLRFSTLKESIVNGVASMIINLAGATVTWLYNRVVVLHLGEIGIAAATIVLYARFMLNSVLSGYASGVAPVISFNFGKKDFTQVKLLFRTSLKAVLAGSALVFLASIFLRGPIVSLFASGEPELAALATRGIFLFAFSYLFNGVNTFAATLFSALNNGKVSAVMAFLTTFVFLVAAIFGLPALGLGADGVWLAVPAAELLSLFVTVFLLKRNRSKYGF